LQRLTLKMSSFLAPERQGEAGTFLQCHRGALM
jgi:hypothetical protein